MLTRRQFLERTLKGSSLVALGAVIPQFLANTARAAEPGKDNVLVVLEMTGGNDGLNTVVPFADDLYYKHRPTLGLKLDRLIRVDDTVGLNQGFRSLEFMLQNQQLAILQGVGYPNPDRSHFESMDIWHKADPSRRLGTGWLGRSLAALAGKVGDLPAAHVGTDATPLALTGAGIAVPSVHPSKPYGLELDETPGDPGRFDRNRRRFAFAAPTGDVGPGGPTTPDRQKQRKELVKELAKLSPAKENSMLDFVQRANLQTYTTIDRLQELTRNNREERFFFGPGANAPTGRFGELAQNLNLVARIIQAGFGTRIFYVSIDGFDTHSDQAKTHEQLLQQISDAVANFYNQLQASGHANRVVLMTFSEFGRRVKENGSKGTDHGAASCMFLAGPAVKGGVYGKHPSLKPEDLDSGDLKYHTDFRQVYATMLDNWLQVKSKDVLFDDYKPLALLRKPDEIPARPAFDPGRGPGTGLPRITPPPPTPPPVPPTPTPEKTKAD